MTYSLQHFNNTKIGAFPAKTNFLALKSVHIINIIKFSIEMTLLL